MSVSSPDLSDLLATHREAMVRYIRGIVRNDAEAEDLAQETLLRAHNRLSTLEDPDRLIPWLYRIATNITHDRFRQPSWRNPPLPLDEEQGNAGASARLYVISDDAPRLDALMERKEMSACVRGYIEELSNPYRAVILLHDLQGLTNPEIAEMLGVSLATVKIRLHRARKKLKAALAECCSFSEDERGVFVCEPLPTRDPDVSDSDN